MALIETSQFFTYLRVILDMNVFQRWIICAYRQILNRDVEVFCICAQKFLTVILDTKSSSVGLFAHNMQILYRDVEVFCLHVQKLENQ